MYISQFPLENKKLIEKVGMEYVDINKDTSCLDGYFDAETLRLIANEMDEMKKEKP